METKNIQELANSSAKVIATGFETFTERFKEITHRAKIRFETRNTYGFYNDAAERIDLYAKSTIQIVKTLKERLAEDTQKKRNLGID